MAELCDILQLPQSTVSRHLKVLGDLGWVGSRKEGTAHFYRTILDELDPAARRLWLVSREQTDRWATVAQDQLRLQRAAPAALPTANHSSPVRPANGTPSAANSMAIVFPPPRASDCCRMVGGRGPRLRHRPDRRRSCSIRPSGHRHRQFRGHAQSRPPPGCEFSNVELRRGELISVPIDDDSCDAALIVLALTYIRPPRCRHSGSLAHSQARR